MATGLSFENPLFSNLMFYAMLLALKLIFMSFFTVFYRITKSVFANQEDLKLGQTKHVNLNDPDVERIRRNHLNDIENILPFILVGLFYVTTNPSATMALLHFRTFTISRFLHMICYQLAVPQPSRALCFITGSLVTVSMAVQNIMACL